MKKLLTFLFLFGTISLYAQEECKALLADGMYKKIKRINRTDYSSDFRSYFSSSEFKSDMRSGDWGTSLALPIEGVPISIGINSSDEEFTEFSKKVNSARQVTINLNTLESIAKELPNPDLYNAYLECIRVFVENSNTGLVQGGKVETEKTVTFYFYFRPASTSQKTPKITSFEVEPRNALISANGIRKGKALPSNVMSVFCRRSEVNEVTLNIQTTDGPITHSSAPTKSSRYETPVGTIVASYLSFDRFREAVGENGVWRATNRWAPCDGRNIYNSELSNLAGLPKTPDLRGVFLRGLNSFDINPPADVVSVNANQADPETRTVGNLQQDSFEDHIHAMDQAFGFSGSGSNNAASSPDRASVSGTRGSTTGGTETRPTNRAIYYYIKIN